MITTKQLQHMIEQALLMEEFDVQAINFRGVEVEYGHQSVNGVKKIQEVVISLDDLGVCLYDIKSTVEYVFEKISLEVPTILIEL